MKPTVKLEMTLDNLCTLCDLLGEDIDRNPPEALQNPSGSLAEKISLYNFMTKVIVKRNDSIKKAPGR